MDDLDHLYRGGRINKATAVVGGALGIKPLLHMDLEGKLNTYAKERGRRKALQSMAQEMAKRTGGYQNPIAYICHGDCEEDANLLADLVHQKTGVGQVMVTSIGGHHWSSHWPRRHWLGVFRKSQISPKGGDFVRSSPFFVWRLFAGKD